MIITMNWSDDPVKDAEMYAYNLEIKRPLIGECIICGREIRGEDDEYYKDDAYWINDDLVCDDCLRDYAKKYLCI